MYDCICINKLLSVTKSVVCRGNWTRPCYKQTRFSTRILRCVVIVYASMTWFFFIVLPFALMTAGPTYSEVTLLNNNYCNYAGKLHTLYLKLHK